MMNNIQISVLLVVAILTPSQEHKFGFENRYTCHCIHDEICDNVTGSCNDGCLKGWGGPSCQQENIALGSDNVSQSGSLFSFESPKQAVDGYTETSWSYEHPCIHTSFSTWSWWFIALQRQLIIHTCIHDEICDNVTGSCNDGCLKGWGGPYCQQELDDFKGFSVHIDNELCFKHTGSSPPPAEYSIECGKTIIGRNVNISNNIPGDSFHFLSLCEVEIYVCSRGTYGPDCNSFCHCSKDGCDVKTGQCTKVCEAGFYGEYCNQFCSNCNGYKCDYYGNCVDGCIDGYHGGMCDYRSNCSKGCLNGICSRDKGSCKDGCVRGKRGRTCANDCKRNCKSCDQYDHYNCKECSDGWFGSSCNNRCPSNCIKCNPRTGDCSECRITWYGKSCNHQCIECSDGICAMNGTCINGCINGKYGNHCQNNCSYSCKQQGNSTGICEQKTGRCIEGCRAGYQGENCTEVAEPVCNYNPTITVPETLGDACVNLSAMCNGVEGLALEYSIPSFIVTTLENGDIQICGNTSAAPLEVGVSQIQVTVLDGFNTLDITMNLSVIAVNKYPPVFNNLPDEFKVEIPEDTLVGSDVFTFTITDDDVGNFGKFTVTSKTEGFESGTFEVVDGMIKLLRKLNASSTPMYTIFLTATDTGGLSDNLTVKIQVQDVNEPPVCIQQATFNISVLMVDGEVGKLSCYDYDVNPLFKQIRYNLIRPQSKSVPFTVDEDGMLKVTGSLLELPETLEFTVEASTGDQATSIAVTVYISPIPILKKVLISFSVTYRVWDNRMVNNQSLEYKQLKQEIEENFMAALSNDPGFAGIEIINMRPGSVICDGVIFVNERGTVHVQDTSNIFLLQVYSGILGYLSVQDGIVYQADQHISSSNITLLEADPDKLLEGTSIEFACKFRLVGTHEAIKPIVKWFLDEIPLTHTSRIKMRNLTVSGDRFGYRYIIQFVKATPSHAGLLKCMVQSSTNSAINTSTTEIVKIISIPVVTLWPLSTFLQSGESVTLKCSSAISPVTYSWFDAQNDSEIVSARDKDVYKVSDVDKDIQVYCKGENVAGTTQSHIATVYYASITSESVTCTNSTDARNTTWPSVKAGTTVKLSCGEEYSDGGFAERDCSESGDWRQPDYSNCKRSKLIGLKRGTDDVKEGKIVTTPKTTLQTLASLTTDGKQFSAGDVEVSVQILMDVVDITNDDTKVEIGEPELKNFAQSASNILDADDEEWKTLADQGKSGIAVMMDTVDTMAKLCSSRLEDKEPITASTDKMVIEIGKFEEGSNDIEFPRPSSKSYPNWMKTSSNKVILRKDTLVYDNTDIKDISYNAVFYNDISKIVEGRILSPGESIDSKSNETAAEINSKILAVSVYPPPKKLDPPIELSFQHLSDDYPSTTCVFLDLKPPYDKRGRWSTEGCKTESTPNPNVTICKCDHLTNFAILMRSGITPMKHREALSIISAIGCAISTFCLLLTVVVYIYFWRYVKSDKAIILMNLCVTLIIAYAIFLGGVNRTDIKALCQTVAVLLHFFFLAVFFLMLAEGVQVLISVVALAMTSRLKWILSASWGLPVVIVVISVAVTQLEGYGNDEYCWLSFESGLLWAFIGPALAVILVNAIIMVKVLTVMFSTTTMVTKTMKEKGRTGLKALCVLLPIIGLTWVFGVFSVNGYAVIFQFLFAIFNSLQGLFIFIFHCFLNRQVKEAIKIKRRRYRAKSIDTGTKSVTQSNQTRSTCDNDKVTSFIDENTTSPVLEADCQVHTV